MFIIHYSKLIDMLTDANYIQIAIQNDISAAHIIIYRIIFAVMISNLGTEKTKFKQELRIFRLS